MFVHRLKLRRPQPPSLPIERDALAASCTGSANVVSIVAGPGYGKTVFAGQLADRWQGTAFWYGLDRSDDDLAVFAAHLEAMVCGTAGDDFAAPATSPREVGARYAEALIDADRPLVVFDDVHALEDARTLAALAEFIERGIRAGACFVLCGRSMPLSLHYYAARHALKLIGAPELAFDEGQSARYLASVRGGPYDEFATLRALARSAEGWPAGLALIASAEPSPDALARAEHARDDETRRFLFDYLAAEVLDALDARERRFLLETSILDELDVTACDAVVGGPGSAGILSSIARRGLFVTRRSEAEFSAHQLFRAFLRHELLRTYAPEEVVSLRRRAANEALRRGDAASAIVHFLESNDVESACVTFERHALEMLASGMVARAGAFLEGLGEMRIASSATLLTVRGRLQQMRGDWERALGSLENAIAVARASQQWDVLAEAVRVLTPIVASRGEFERAATLLEETLTQPLSEIVRATLSLTLGAVHLEAGNVDTALALFSLASPLIVARGDLALQGIVLHNTGVAQVRRGDPIAAAATYERALAVKRRAGQRVSALLTLGNLVVVRRVVGEYAAAERLARETLDEGRDVGNATMIANALANLAALELDLGRIDAAERTFAEARDTCDPSDVLVLPEVIAGLGRIALLRGDAASAEDLSAQAASLLRRTRRREVWAGLALTRARAALMSGDVERTRFHLVESLREATEQTDDVVFACIALDVAVTYARIGDGESSEAAASAALACIAEREYGFLRRTKAAAIAELRLARPYESNVAPLRIECFGGFRVFVEGRPVAADAWKRRKARDIFAYLVCRRGKPVARERLADLFWGDVDADAAHDNLRVTISAVRKAVGNVVKYDVNGYRFAPPPGTALDIDAVDEAAAAARAATAASRTADAIASYARIALAYTGDLLDGFLDPWPQRERERFRGVALEALRAVLERERDPATRLTLIDRVLDIAPFDVAAVRERLDALAADARLPDARRAYRAWRERYRDSLGDEAPDVWSPPVSRR